MSPNRCSFSFVALHEKGLLRDCKSWIQLCRFELHRSFSLESVQHQLIGATMKSAVASECLKIGDNWGSMKAGLETRLTCHVMQVDLSSKRFLGNEITPPLDRTSKAYTDVL